ncbi:MAG: DUF1573 domain-containing protein [Rubricoccaceae bacterium]|nr:DUF1573 domain-containing protein [Rubricoccaceae bacterium]
MVVSSRFFSLLLAAFIALICLEVNAQGVPTFASLEHDFGSITEGDKPTHTFVFTNTGDTAVQIEHVQPSCGCTAPSYSTDPVEPGEDGEIVVEYNSEGRPGDFNKTITINFTGSASPSQVLRITGSVTPTHLHNGVVQGGVTFDADRHTFEGISAADAVEHVFRMQNDTDNPIHITEARAFSNGVRVTYPERPIFPGEIVNILVRVEEVGATLNARGQMDVAVVLQTDDDMLPAKSLRLVGRIETETGDVASQ